MSLFGLYVPIIVVYFYLFIIGMCLGSFFMVVGYRVPKKESLVGRSHCDDCHHKLVAWQLIPGISYIFLKGKCRYCSSKIGVISPIFECLTGVLFVMSVALMQLTPEIIVSITLISLLLIVSVSDIKYQIIPNKVLGPFMLLGIIERFFIPQNEYWWYPIAGLLVGFLPLFILTEIKEKAMGGGDIKLFAIIGIFIGPFQVVAVLFVASVVALIYYLGMILMRRQSSKFIPFGPFIGIGTLLVYQYSTGQYETLIELLFR
ncbi:prepilin peptidase [Vagococcus sp. BWB3-3]|uniref:Prepilin peptidase n=1 Tax=Vagococcus allomyrinae TaxID=2794353 RepID=A0A940PDF5_9ENTE|nr:A24 family peptidase [Vagococcus allomyrinae]MBP1042775.1 prepilin peptidase [Vagococcus allomyrinae]